MPFGSSAVRRRAVRQLGSITIRQRGNISNVIQYTDKKGNEIFLIYKESQMGSVAKSYNRKGFLIYEEMRKYLTIYEEAISHI